MKPFYHEIVVFLLSVTQISVAHMKTDRRLRSCSERVEDAGAVRIMLEPYFLQALGELRYISKLVTIVP